MVEWHCKQTIGVCYLLSPRSWQEVLAGVRRSRRLSIFIANNHSVLNVRFEPTSNGSCPIPDFERCEKLDADPRILLVSFLHSSGVSDRLRSIILTGI